MSTSAILFLTALILGMAGLSVASTRLAAVCLGTAILSAVLALLTLPLPA